MSNSQEYQKELSQILAEKRAAMVQIVLEKSAAMDKVIKSAVENGISVHLLVKNEPSVAMAWKYFSALGLKRDQSGMRELLFVHSIIDEIPSGHISVELDSLIMP